MDEAQGRVEVKLALMAYRLESEEEVLRSAGFDIEADEAQRRASEYRDAAGPQYSQVRVFLTKVKSRSKILLLPWMISTEVH